MRNTKSWSVFATPPPRGTATKVRKYIHGDVNLSHVGDRMEDKLFLCPVMPCGHGVVIIWSGGDSTKIQPSRLYYYYRHHYARCSMSDHVTSLQLQAADVTRFP